MPKTVEGYLTGEGLKFGLVMSRFNEFITGKLLEGALDALYRHGVQQEDVLVAMAPGSFEIPMVAKKMAQQKKYDAIICLGAVIRGATTHHEYIASEVTKGIANTSLETGVPIAFGVLTTDSLEQAIERAGTKMGNKGFEAAMSALEMVNLYKALEG